ncbi:hypothetical protein HDU76_011553 [Blyttiomyces sp. JEL0837]|nr:hypothetical protein HDU76_011553 [Blyttiomyces sp. JEL0837]
MQITNLLLVLTTSASIVTAQSVTDPTAAVNQIISSLPICAKACLQTVPGVKLPATLDVVENICQNLLADEAIFDACIQANCTQIDITTSTDVEKQLQAGCQILFGGVSSSMASTMSGTASAIATGTPSGTSAAVSTNTKSGAAKYGYVTGVNVASFVAGLGFLVTVAFM